MEKFWIVVAPFTEFLGKNHPFSAFSRSLWLASKALLCFSLIALFSCNPPKSQDERPTFPPTEQLRVSTEADAYTDMLRRRVNRNGRIHYAGIRQNPRALDEYIDHMRERYSLLDNAPGRERKAYWANLYNALVLRLVVEHYPIASILNIGLDEDELGSPSLKEINLNHTNHPFDIALIQLGGEDYSLRRIKDDVIRGEFKDPRMHFVLVDACQSSPRLRRNLYQGKEMNQQLDEATREFLNDPRKNSLNPNAPVFSALFEEFARDFGGSEEALINWVNGYIPITIRPGASISYNSFDWGLNGY